MALEPERKGNPLQNMAKGLLNGFTAATLMFAPGAMVPPSYAAEEGVVAADAEAPKPKKKKAKAKKTEEPVVAAAPDASPAASDAAAEAPKPKKKKAKAKKTEEPVVAAAPDAA